MEVEKLFDLEIAIFISNLLYIDLYVKLVIKCK